MLRLHPAPSTSLALLTALLFAPPIGACTPQIGDTSASSTSDSDSESDSSGEMTATTVNTSTTTTATTTTTTDATDATSMDTTTTMTTTTSDPTTATTTGEPVCGDGEVEGAEECDDGSDNADDAACTSACMSARCGDGLIHTGSESCDDGTNNGDYGTCNPDCSLGPRCGDEIVQADDGEECDGSDPASACLTTCKVAPSCFALKADRPAAPSGVFAIKPASQAQPLDAYCDMESDGGGYTFLKVALTKAKIASEAEGMCAGYGMQLLIPRSPAHAAAAYAVAMSSNVPHKGDGNLDVTAKYLSILGIYPVTKGQSCTGMPLNSTECLEWEASDKKAYFISGEGQADEPSIKNCDGCSMYYDWKDGADIQYVASNLKGGGSSLAFLCDVGDKTP